MKDNNMNKPFDTTKPVQTRDGRKARIICTDAKGKYPLVALVDTEENEMALNYLQNGKFFSDREHNNDLVNIPETKTVEFWVNVYNDGEVGNAWRTKEDAIGCRDVGLFAVKKVTIEVKEGEGL